MQVEVNVNTINITQYDELNSGEYNAHNCEFTFSQEYDGLTKIAVFTTNKSYECLIENGRCNIPYQVLELEGNVIFGVYGYQKVDDKLELRYSPTPVLFFVQPGSYVKEASSGITPEQAEDLQLQLEELIAEIQHDLDTGAFDGADGQDGAPGQDGFSPTLRETQTLSGYNIEITDVNGTRNINLLNGANGQDGQPGPQGAPGKDGKDGVDGKDGQQGPQGVPGKDGVNGVDGKDGKDGKDGTDGQDGYTPVRGTDYWTAADIATIEQYCDDYIDANITQAIGGSY